MDPLIPDDPKAGCPLGPSCGCQSGSAHWWYMSRDLEITRHQIALRDQRNDILLAVNEALVPFGFSVARGTIDGEDVYEGMKMPTVNGDAETERSLAEARAETEEAVRGCLSIALEKGAVEASYATLCASVREIEPYLQHKPECERISHRRSDDGGVTFAFPPQPCKCGRDDLATRLRDALSERTQKPTGGDVAEPLT
jgi:hypothetical protein